MTWLGTAGEDKASGGEDFLRPRCPQEPLDQRHKSTATSPHKGAFAGPFCSHLFLVCFAFSPLGFSLFLGMPSGPGHLASSAVQHCWSCHAPAWELLLPASLLQSPPARTARWQFSTSKCTHAAIRSDAHCSFSSEACSEKRSEAGSTTSSSQKLPACQHIRKGETGE